MFARAVNEDATIQTALQDVIFLTIDCEKGEGPEIAAKYNVRGYPSYVAVDQTGEVVGRWIGYEGPEAWAAAVAGVLKDPRPVTAKLAAYEQAPTLDLALALANDASTRMDNAASVGFFRKARELDPDNADEYDTQILLGMYYGQRDQTFTVDQLVAQADVVFGHDLEPGDRAEIALMIRQITAGGASEAAVPFIRSALAATEGVEDEDVAASRRNLLVESALLIDHDPVKALELKRLAMPDGWQDSVRGLNRFAWWCFENNVNLDEALALALKAVGLADSPGDQANLLDTVAEICNAMGNCGEAVEHMRRAVELSPDRQYYKDQLARFEALLAEQGEG